ncbi:MAG: hypothetical protein ACR2HJ_02800 [Fimbriimonadales bacterium]
MIEPLEPGVYEISGIYSFSMPILDQPYRVEYVFTRGGKRLYSIAYQGLKHAKTKFTVVK